MPLPRPSPTDPSACVGKTAHHTKAEALKEIASLRLRGTASRDGAAPVRAEPFRCDVCHAWHVGPAWRPKPLRRVR